MFRRPLAIVMLFLFAGVPAVSTARPGARGCSMCRAACCCRPSGPAGQCRMDRDCGDEARATPAAQAWIAVPETAPEDRPVVEASLAATHGAPRPSWHPVAPPDPPPRTIAG